MGQRDIPTDWMFPSRDWRSRSAWNPVVAHLFFCALRLSSPDCGEARTRTKSSHPNPKPTWVPSRASLFAPGFENRLNLIGSWTANGFSSCRSGACLQSNQKELLTCSKPPLVGWLTLPSCRHWSLQPGLLCQNFPNPHRFTQVHTNQGPCQHADSDSL